MSDILLLIFLLGFIFFLSSSISLYIANYHLKKTIRTQEEVIENFERQMKILGRHSD